MSLGFKHKSKVEDNVKLLQNVLNNSLEKQINKSDEIQEIKGLKNLKEQVDYSIDSRLYNKSRIIQGKTNKNFILL